MTINEQERIEKFAKAATGYCRAIENLESISREALITELAEVLPELYTAAWQLPQTEIVSEELPPSIHTVDEHMRLFNALRRKLGDWDAYRCVFDPTRDQDAISCNLATDLADIYRDVRQYSESIAAGAALADVVWEMRIGFESHWGRHLASALTVVHELRLRIP
jgi:hypothetical protein